MEFHILSEYSWKLARNCLLNRKTVEDRNAIKCEISILLPLKMYQTG